MNVAVQPILLYSLKPAKLTRGLDDPSDLLPSAKAKLLSKPRNRASWKGHLVHAKMEPSALPDGDLIERVGWCPTAFTVLHTTDNQTAANPGLHTHTSVFGAAETSRWVVAAARSSVEARYWLISVFLPTPNRVVHRAEDLSRPRIGDFSWRLTRPVLVVEGVELISPSITR